jgi:chaperonin cofactor prefoldin
MEWQTLINIGAGTFLTVIGWFARELWDVVKVLKQDVQQLEIKIAEDYVKKEDINTRFDKLDALLQRIFDKLETKADK